GGPQEPRHSQPAHVAVGNLDCHGHLVAVDACRDVRRSRRQRISPDSTTLEQGRNLGAHIALGLAGEHGDAASFAGGIGDELADHSEPRHLDDPEHEDEEYRQDQRHFDEGPPTAKVFPRSDDHPHGPSFQYQPAITWYFTRMTSGTLAAHG